MGDQYAIYLRKSRADLEAEARGEGDTYARHEHALLELSRRLKINVTKIYRETPISGETISARPVVQEILSDVEQNLWKGILVMEVERLARGDTIDQGIVAQTFKYSNTKIVTPMKTYDPSNESDEEYFEFGLFMSRREYKTINRRLQSGRMASVKEGKYVGNKPPYGYRRVKLEKQKGYSLEEEPAQGDIVRLIFDLYTSGDKLPDGSLARLGVSLVVRKLNNLGIPPAVGDVWVNASVQQILRNPVYIGKIRWAARPQVKKMVDGKMIKSRPRAKDYILIDGLQKPIIDLDTWDKAQKYISENHSRPVPTRYITKNPLSGLIICGKCGRRMVRRPYSGKNAGQPDTLMCYNTACSNIASQLSYVEDRLLKSIDDWLYDYKASLKMKDSIKPDIQVEVKKKALLSLEDELKKAEKQIDNLHDLLEQGVYSTDKFLERSKVLSERIGHMKERQKVLADELKNGINLDKQKTLFIPIVEKVLKIYRTSRDPAKKNDLLKEIVEKAVYTKTVNGRWHNRPDDFDLELFPLIPK